MILHNRLKDSAERRAKYRKDIPVIKPNLNTAVARLPEEFVKARNYHYEEI